MLCVHLVYQGVAAQRARFLFQPDLGMVVAEDVKLCREVRIGARQFLSGFGPCHFSEPIGTKKERAQ
jgi:hypothetical protein